MTTRNWIGTDNESASDAGAWLPSGIPVPGDMLLVSPGSTLNIVYHDLAGNTVLIPKTQPGRHPVLPQVMFNLSADASLTLRGENKSVKRAVIDVITNATVDYTGVATPAGHSAYAMPVTVNLGDGAHLLGKFAMDSTSLTVTAGSDSTFAVNDTEDLIGTHAVINPDVVGSGVWHVTAMGARASSLEFMRGVEYGQDIDVRGIISSITNVQLVSILKIDHPDMFFGQIHLEYGSSADLVGLGGTDHWSYEGVTLSLFDKAGGVLQQVSILDNDRSRQPGTRGLSVTTNSTGDLFLTPGGGYAGAVVKIGV